MIAVEPGECLRDIIIRCLNLPQIPTVSRSRTGNSVLDNFMQHEYTTYARSESSSRKLVCGALGLIEHEGFTLYPSRLSLSRDGGRVSSTHTREELQDSPSGRLCASHKGKQVETLP